MSKVFSTHKNKHERDLRYHRYKYLTILGQESCRTKVSRIFRIFIPNFAPNFAPNFPRIFRGLFVLRFVGDGDQKKFTKNPRHFPMQNSQANTKKIFTKCFWRAGKVTRYEKCCCWPLSVGDRILYTTPLEARIATDTFTPSPAPEM